MWAQQAISPVRGNSSGAVAGLGERLSFGGHGALGFALEAADPGIWPTLSSAQQMWVSNTLNKLNDIIVSATGTHCPTWGPAINLAGGCFQVWFNAQNMGLTKPDGSKVVLRTDGTFDQDTLDALRTVTAMQPQNFKDPYPGTSLPGQTGTGEKKLSTGAMVGIGIAGAAALGGLAYLATHKKKR